MRRNIKVSLLSLLILIVSFTLIYYTTSAFTTSSKNPSTIYFTDIYGQPQPLTKEVRENNAKLNQAIDKLVPLYLKISEAGAPLAGFYVDVVAGSLKVGLTEIRKEYTKPIKEVVGDIVKIEFYQANFSLNELKDVKQKLIENINELNHKNIPIITIGINEINNVVTVGLEELKTEYMETIKELVKNKAPEITKKGNPLSFHRASKLTKLSRESWHPNLFGGIRISTYERVSTLGFSARLWDGTRGFIMTGHTGFEGAIVYQPFTHRVGIITKNPRLSHRFSDAAFVGNPTRPVINTIWPNRTVVDWRASWNTPPGTFVDMEGATTGYSWGIIVERWKTYSSRTFEQLLEQVVAVLNPIPSDGDSGGPIFSWGSDPNQVRVCGVLVGMDSSSTYGTVTIYSPVDGIQRDLTLIWGPP